MISPRLPFRQHAGSLSPPAMIRAAALAVILVSCVKSEDYCYDEPHCDPYAWGDMFPPCHPLIEEHHSPINLDHRMTRDPSLGPLHLDGFNETQTGHWTLKNDGHSIVLQVGGAMSVSGGGLADMYHTVQVHFHWGGVASNGSEHTVDGRRYPMEMHVVNMKSIHPNVTAALGDPTGLAVLGFFIDVGFLRALVSAHDHALVAQEQLPPLTLCFIPGRLRGQCALWTRLAEAVLGGLQRPSDQNQAVPACEPPAEAQPESVLPLLGQPHHPSVCASGGVDSVRSSHLHLVDPTGPVHLADLLHGGGRGAGDPSAEQLQARPPHLWPRRLRVQRRRGPGGDVRSSAWAGRVAASASCGFARKLLVWTLTRLQKGGFSCLTTKGHLGDDLQRT